MKIIWTELRLVLLTAPALALPIIPTATGASLGNSIQAIIFMEGAASAIARNPSRSTSATNAC